MIEYFTTAKQNKVTNLDMKTKCILLIMEQQAAGNRDFLN